MRNEEYIVALNNIGNNVKYLCILNMWRSIKKNL